jgi:hypothetical protein
LSGSNIFLENKFFLVGRCRVNAAPEMADVYWLARLFT